MTDPTNSLERALVLLETIEQMPSGLTNAESSRLLRIPKSSCSYIMTRLKRKGYLVLDEDTGRYRIGLTPVALAYGALRDMGFRSIGEPALYKLASDTGLSANIGVLERGRVLLVDRVESPRFVRGIVEEAGKTTPSVVRSKGLPVFGIRRRDEREIGRELPCDGSAIGNVLLAYLTKPDLLNLIKEYGLTRVTTTKVSLNALLTQLANVRKQGYATSYGEYEEGLCAIAAPITDASGVARGAVSIDGYSSEADWSESGRLIELVTAAGRDISRRARIRADTHSLS
jgi:DNA-binding IclR family transcriptional regulator